MHNEIEAIRQRYVEVFSAGILDIPKGCSLARADIAKLLDLHRESEGKFKMLGTCLAGILAVNGGKMDVPKKLVLDLAEQYEKAAGKHFVLTAVDINEIDGDKLRISLRHESLIKKDQLEVPTTTKPSFQPVNGPEDQDPSSRPHGPRFSSER